MSKVKTVKERRFIADYINVAGADAAEAKYAFMGAGFETLDDQPAAQKIGRAHV